MVLLLMLIFVFVLIGVLGIISAAYAYLNKKNAAYKTAIILFSIGGIGTIIVTAIYTKKSLEQSQENRPQKEVQRTTFQIQEKEVPNIYNI
ncbi:MAG TPA: hypothetical protein PKX92_11670 [Edaphocola sp.]|nr:hypothetical protein [Edaphocola sp.]